MAAPKAQERALPAAVEEASRAEPGAKPAAVHAWWLTGAILLRVAFVIVALAFFVLALRPQAESPAGVTLSHDYPQDAPTASVVDASLCRSATIRLGGECVANQNRGERLPGEVLADIGALLRACN